MAAVPDPKIPSSLLGGLSPQQFMKRHWQKKPLVIRGALPGVEPPVDRAALFALAAREDVESRLIRHDAEGGWQLRHGPVPRRALPPLSRAGWTLLVQGLDLHLAAAHELLCRFRFVPDARLDDLMVSFATDGGGVGPHVDSYDVFLLQVHGRRRWRFGRPGDATLQPGLPLKILARFEPEEEVVLEPGDMLYLPPQWAHDGVAEGECMTCSIGFRAPARDELAREVLHRHLDALADEAADGDGDVPPVLYRDPAQPATAQPGEIPPALRASTVQAVRRLLDDAGALDCALGELLSEPKPGVAFDDGVPLAPGQGVRLDRRTRMLWDDRHVYINGESFRAAGRDATLMRRLADRRGLPARDLARLGEGAAALLADWAEAGWLHASAGDEAG